MKNIGRIMVALVAAAALSGCGTYDLTETERDKTELGASDYAGRSGGKFVSCSGSDSDGDGYVTCATQTSAGAAEDLLCSYKSRGCKRK